MIVVSDTSPVSNLIQIDQLNILKQLFGEVLISPIVYEELCEIAIQKDVIDKQDWIIIKDTVDEEIKKALGEKLDKGEAEAIALALHVKADFLLIDELKGRAFAEELGLKIIGLIGVLIKAKSERLIIEIKPLLDQLIYNAGFHIHRSLYLKVLEITDENRPDE